MIDDLPYTWRIPSINESISLEDYHQTEPKSAHFLMDVALKNCSKAVRNQEHPKKPTKAMVNGTLIHTAIETKNES